MTAKDKAKELVSNYECGYSINGYHYNFCNDLEDAKQCALIAVYEMIKQQKEQSDNMRWSCITYWEEVKYEIEKI
jgi:hypothetical protein